MVVHGPENIINCNFYKIKKIHFEILEMSQCFVKIEINLNMFVNLIGNKIGININHM